MTKRDLINIITDLDDDENINLNELAREEAEYRQERIEELEERQHQSGFYAFQDTMAMWRYER